LGLGSSLFTLACTSGEAGAVGENLVVTSHCSVSGAGTLPSGDAASGDMYDESGIASGTWLHDGAAGDLVGAPTDIVCRINGSRIADVSGTGTYGGAPGHTFTLHVQDRGAPGGGARLPGDPEPRTIVASRLYSPSRWTDGVASFAEGALVEVPSALPVTVGNAGNQWARVTFVEHDSGDPIRCSYRGGASRANPVSAGDVALGLEYGWARCERWDASSSSFATDAAIVPGTVLDVDSIEVHVQHGSSRHPSCDAAETTVTLELMVTPLVTRPSEPDYYRLLVFDPSGALVLFSEGDLASGDIAVAELP
jgi:hypothetical protein